MFGDGSLTFREFVMREPVPLATIQDAVLEFLRGRDDAVLYGAQAVNAYVKEPRMTQDVDIASTRAKELAEELRLFLNRRFKIAVRVRAVRKGIGFRVYQIRKPENRHLIDVRPVKELPPSQLVKDVMVLTPPELIAAKVLSMVSREKTPKGAIDLGDLRRLLLTFPNLKKTSGPVTDCLLAAGAAAEVMKAWRKIATDEILPEDEEDKFAW